MVRRRILLLLGAGVALTALLTVCVTCAPIRPRDEPLTTERSAPDFLLPDQNGATVTLAALLANGPAIIIFYRGYW